MQWGVVAIPKSVRKEYILDNIDVFDFALTDEEMVNISLLDVGLKTVDHTAPAFLIYLHNRSLL